jgi:hypothetical protein
VEVNEFVTLLKSVTVKVAVYWPGILYLTWAVAPVAEAMLPPLKVHLLS